MFQSDDLEGIMHDRAVWSPIYTISGTLDTTLSEIFMPDYAKRLDAAKERLRADLYEDADGPAASGRDAEAAPQAHQIERGTAGNHGESSRARRGRAPTIRPGQRPNRPQMLAASQAESASSILVTRSSQSARSAAWGLFVVPDILSPSPPTRLEIGHTEGTGFPRRIWPPPALSSTAQPGRSFGARALARHEPKPSACRSLDKEGRMFGVPGARQPPESSPCFNCCV
jgi:hypothetical protein